MDKDVVYLKQNIQVEPLVNGWYAWVHLLSPVTNALNLAERYLNIMDSYISSPMVHALAVKDPNMRGGPFIDLDGGRVEAVKELRAEMVERSGSLIELAEAVKQLRTLLREKAKGYCMESLYQEMPEILRGYVELYYDLNNNPAFRFFETLLYKSTYNTTRIQSIALSEIRKDGERPFILSTPRLKDDHTLHLQLPFSHTGLDELFKMKREPKSFDFIRERLNIPDSENQFFRSFFTSEAPAPYDKYTGENIRIRYFGHACILVETRDVSILLDPVLSYTYESEVSRYTYADLPDTIDYVLITHSHQDHILIETMLQIRHKVKNIVVGRNIDGALQDPSLKLLLNNAGFRNVMEIRELEEISIPNGSIMGIPFMGEHHDLHIHSKLGYLIRIAGRSVLAVADSCNIEPALYERIYQLTGNLDILFLGMECDGSPASWVYGPLLDGRMERRMDLSRRGRGCNYAEGIDIVKRFNFKEVYVYAMGQEPWLRHILDLEFTEASNPVVQSRKLIEECRKENMVAENLFGEREII